MARSWAWLLFACLRAVVHMIVRAFLVPFEKIFIESLLLCLVLFSCVLIKLEGNWCSCYFGAFLTAKKTHC